MLKQCNRLVVTVLAVAAISGAAACGNGAETVTVEDDYPDMPRVCDLVPQSTVDELVPPTADSGGVATIGETAMCTWSYQPSEIPEGTESQPYRRELEVAVTRYEATGDRPGSYWAQRTFEQLRELGMGPSEDLPGIGDQAYQWFGRYGVDEAGIEFIRANLTVRVTYGGNDVTETGESVEIEQAMAFSAAGVAADEVDRALLRLK